MSGALYLDFKYVARGEGAHALPPAPDKVPNDSLTLVIIFCSATATAVKCPRQGSKVLLWQREERHGGRFESVTKSSRCGVAFRRVWNSSVERSRWQRKGIRLMDYKLIGSHRMNRTNDFIPTVKVIGCGLGLMSDVQYKRRVSPSSGRI